MTRVNLPKNPTGQSIRRIADIWDNFDAIAAILNGQLDDENIKSSSLSSRKVKITSGAASLTGGAVQPGTSATPLNCSVAVNFTYDATLILMGQIQASNVRYYDRFNGFQAWYQKDGVRIPDSHTDITLGAPLLDNTPFRAYNSHPILPMYAVTSLTPGAHIIQMVAQRDGGTNDIQVGIFTGFSYLAFSQ